MTIGVYEVVHCVTNYSIHLNSMKGFVSVKQSTRSSSYWIAIYTKENDDEPIEIYKKVLNYKQGQDKEKLIINYCNSIMKTNNDIWEMLIHQGPSEIPNSGDQIVLRLSRERFKGCTQIKN